MARRLFPNLLGYETAPGTLDLLGGEVRAQEPDGRGIYSNPTTLASIGGFRTPGMGEPFRTPLTSRGREMARRAEIEAGYQRGASRRPTASQTGYETSPGGTGTLGRTAGGEHPQNMPANGRPPLADGQPQRRGGVMNWLNAPAFGDRGDGGGSSRPMSRMGLLGEMLLGISAGIGQTPAGGNWLGGGIAGASGGLRQAQEYEERRRQEAFQNEYRRLNTELKQRQLERQETPRPVSVGPGERLIDPSTGQQIAEGGPAPAKAYGSLEAALLSPDPEVRARAERFWMQRQAPDPLEQARIARMDAQNRIAEQELALQRQKFEFDRSRPAGAPSSAAPTPLGKALAEMQALPEGDPRRATYEEYINRMARSGAAQAGTGEPAPPSGYVAAPPMARNQASEAIVEARGILDKAAAIEGYGDRLPELMTTQSTLGNVVTGAQQRLGLPVDPARERQLSEQSALHSQIEELAGAIRHERFGAALTGTELASANRYLPTPGDSVTALREKLKGLKGLAENVIKRQGEVLEKGINIQPPAAQEPPPQTSLIPGEGTAEGPVRVNSPEEARRLPPGTEFMGPDGILRRVPRG